MATARVAKAKAAIRAGQDGLFAGTVCAFLGRHAECGAGDDRASKWAHTSSLWWSTAVYSLSHECEAVERTLVRAYERVCVVVCVIMFWLLTDNRYWYLRVGRNVNSFRTGLATT